MEVSACGNNGRSDFPRFFPKTLALGHFAIAACAMQRCGRVAPARALGMGAGDTKRVASFAVAAWLLAATIANGAFGWHGDAQRAGALLLSQRGIPLQLGAICAAADETTRGEYSPTWRCPVVLVSPDSHAKEVAPMQLLQSEWRAKKQTNINFSSTCFEGFWTLSIPISPFQRAVMRFSLPLVGCGVVCWEGRKVFSC